MRADRAGLEGAPAPNSPPGQRLPLARTELLALCVVLGCGARTGLDDLNPADASPPAILDANASSACTGLCVQQVRCAPGVSTTLSGTAYVPNGTDPLYNAVVYVPNAPLEPFTEGPSASCAACGAPVSGSPLVKTRTAADGSFNLADVPSGSNIPLVVQIGKWRRQVTIPLVTACVNTAVDPNLTRLPKNHTEGDIPLTAVVTGEADALECALIDFGVDEAELTGQGYGGRIHMFGGNGFDATTWADQSDLPGLLPKYDAVFYDCDGAIPGGPDPMKQPIIDYANLGGRVYTSHFGYGILENSPFVSTMKLSSPTQDGDFVHASGLVSGSKIDAQAFLQWLGEVHALTGNGTLDISLPKHDLDAILPPASAWLSTGATSSVGVTTQLYSFATPLGADPGAQCGEVVYASYHVTGIIGTATGEWEGCAPETVTAQERAFEFLVFDLPTCAGP
jgi:hypothetical protein